jgi:hypothetical protein
MVDHVQRIYARWLDRGTRIGLAALIAAFLAYAFQLIEPFVPLASLAAWWGLPADRYLALAGAPTGWAWLRFAGRADYLNLLAVTALSMVPVVCYLRIVPLLWRRGERLHAAIAVAQIVVLVAAASGLIAGRH